MDPLSIIASIAGIATAGAQLSSTLFRIYKTVRYASQDIRKVAMEMAGLTATLEHLHHILQTGKLYAKPSFLDGVRHVVNNIEVTQQEILKRATDNSFIKKLKWIGTPRYLSEINTHKVTLTLQISILSAAILIKSKNESSSIQEKVNNRFILEAESLIQTGQASLQGDSVERQMPQPPAERAPSPPVRTTKRLPSPVRQSSVPGHVWSDELYGQSSTAGNNLDVPKQDNEETSSAMVRHERVHPPSNPHVPSGDDTQGDGDEGWEYQNNRGRSAGYDPLAGRVAQFGQHFHLQGDAATFLYNLVFATEMVQHGTTPKAPSSSGATRGGMETEPSYYSDEYPYPDDDLYTDTEVFDTADDSTHHKDRSKVPTRYVYRRPQEPTRVVNLLLLAWTSLSQSEIEKGVVDEKPTAARGSSFKQSYVESDDESEDEHVQSSQGRSNWPHREEDSGLHSPSYEGHMEEIPQADSPRHVKIRPLGQYNTQGPREYNHFHSGTTAPYNPHMAPNHFSHQQPYQQRYDPWGYPYPAPAWRPPTPSPPPPSTPHAEKMTPQEPPLNEPSKPKFQKPHVIVLPQADVADSETGPITPELGVSPILKMTIVRQGEEAVWNSDDFASNNNIPGKAIMGTLIGDKTARNSHGLDLAHTLIRGQDMKLIYIRGNELGETWFINEQPVFLQFFHCGYLPQFYSAKESDITAMKQEYVAVGEEWASFEALYQLGLTAKGREEGRVLLDPNTTWSMVKELATATLQLRSTFGQKHCGALPEPSVIAGYPSSSLHYIATEPQPAAKLEIKAPDVLTFLVKDEEKIKEVAESQKVQTQNTQPQIAITPPPTPQESSSPQLNTSDMASTVSSSSKSSENGTMRVEIEGDDKRPATPTDSGVGSSVD
ncbi:hypothetical protein FSPOR_1820 [Fusarium sporotrichioides]|uniref:Fungal N-terminal domain-containing protein n=1 Tax=Fusarium sporotrichioides TaxID=5514 RepID=A0A395SQ72_FUSSP|nr:hypothetical protein FSPOR_1820 [Fusarium sporotrichioides]